MAFSTENTCFQKASRDALNYLHTRYGFGLWMVTRTKGVDWVVLQAEDHGYGVDDGDVFQWADSFCSRMVKGEGPRIAPRSDDVPAYVEAPIGSQVPIGAYIGIPLNQSDGELFGTLCAVDPSPQPDSLTDELEQIELVSRLLETVLECESRANDEARRAERAEAQVLTDHLCEVYNRRGWDQLLRTEEKRCQLYAHPASVLAIDLDNLKVVNDTQGHVAGDALLRTAAKVMQDNVRRNDIVARVGGDEFLILGVECKELGIEVMVNRIESALEAAGVSASIGARPRRINSSLRETALEADNAMYEVKRSRKLLAVGR